MTLLRGVFSLAAAFLVPAALPGQILIQQLHVEGNHRLKEPAVIAASGLHLKTQVARADLDAAAQRLVDTGLFTAVTYRYASGSVTLIVTEEAARETVLIDIPGVDPRQFWAQLAADDSTLIDQVIPASPQAIAYYTREIESVLAKAGRPEPLSMQDEIDIATKKTVAIVQPVNKPAIADIAFEGNAAVSTQSIRDRILKLTVGNSYSERDFLRILDANIRPMFEEKGLLQVAFSRIRAARADDGKVVVTTAVDDGRVWQLGKVELEGDDLPVDKMLGAGAFAQGRVANWTAFLAGVENMETVLKHDGFIAASSTPVRTFQPTGLVDVLVKVRKGKQYRFASIDLTGLDEGERRKAMDLWRLQAGQPMDMPYVDEFLRSVAKTVRPSKHSLSKNIRVRPGTDQVDVIVAYR